MFLFISYFDDFLHWKAKNVLIFLDLGVSFIFMLFLGVVQNYIEADLKIQMLFWTPEDFR